MATNEEKANEIIKDIPQCPYHITYEEVIENFTTDQLEECLLDMAKWKDEQFEQEKKQWIEKAHDWLIKNSSKYVGFDENQFLAYAYKTMSDNFIKYMEE